MKEEIDMAYSKNELDDARIALNSTISKCEKSLQKITDKSPQKTLLIRRIKALKISTELIDRELLKLEISGDK